MQQSIADIILTILNESPKGMTTAELLEVLKEKYPTNKTPANSTINRFTVGTSCDVLFKRGMISRSDLISRTTSRGGRYRIWYKKMEE